MTSRAALLKRLELIEARLKPRPYVVVHSIDGLTWYRSGELLWDKEPLTTHQIEEMAAAANVIRILHTFGALTDASEHDEPEPGE